MERILFRVSFAFTKGKLEGVGNCIGSWPPEILGF